jgi:hypothetical protein
MEAPWEQESMNLLFITFAWRCRSASVSVRQRRRRSAGNTYVRVYRQQDELGRLIFGSVLAWLVASEVVIWAAVFGARAAVSPFDWSMMISLARFTR